MSPAVETFQVESDSQELTGLKPGQLKAHSTVLCHVLSAGELACTDRQTDGEPSLERSKVAVKAEITLQSIIFLFLMKHKRLSFSKSSKEKKQQESC